MEGGPPSPPFHRGGSPGVSTTSAIPQQEHDASFGGARDGVAVPSPDWRIRYMNASMLEILRLIGREADVATLWDALPDWRETDEAGTLRESMRSRAAVCFRVDGDRGRGRVWEVQADPLDSGELRVRLRNVTAQARLEEAERQYRAAGAEVAEREARLGAIVSAAPAGIVVFDAASFRVREANDFYHGFLEGRWQSPGAINGRHASEFIPRFEEAGIGD